MIRRFAARSFVTAIACAAVGCARQAPAPGHPIVVDSAGVQLIRHVEESVYPVIEAREIRRIGTVDGADGVRFDRLVGKSER